MVCATSWGWAAEFGCIVFGICFFRWQGVFVIICALGEVDCVGQGRIGYVAEPFTKTVASWWCLLQSMVRDTVRMYTCREEWTVKVMTARTEKSLLSRPLSSDVAMRSICLPM